MDFRKCVARALVCSRSRAKTPIMKTVTFFVVLLALVVNSYRQGAVVFSNSGLGQPVYVCDQTSVYLAPPGSAFQVGLYYAPDGVIDEAQFVQLGNAGIFGPSPGIFSGGGRTAPTPVPGDWAMFQVRGWEAAYGTTYEEASMSTQARIGKSNIFRVDTTNPFLGGQPAQLLGFESFVIASPTCVPEPPLARGLLTLVLLFCWRFSAGQQRVGL